MVVEARPEVVWQKAKAEMGEMGSGSGRKKRKDDAGDQADGRIQRGATEMAE